MKMLQNKKETYQKQSSSKTNQQLNSNEDLPNQLWKLQSMKIQDIFPALSKILKLKEKSDYNFDFKKKFQHKASQQMKNIKFSMNQLFSHTDAYFSQKEINIIHALKILEIKKENQFNKKCQKKHRHNQRCHNHIQTVDQIMMEVEQDAKQTNIKKRKKDDQKQKEKKAQMNIEKQKQFEVIKARKPRARRNKIQTVIGRNNTQKRVHNAKHFQSQSQNQKSDDSSSVKFLGRNKQKDEQIKPFVSGGNRNKGQKRSFEEIFMCTCPYNRSFFRNRDDFLDHLYKVHPSQKQFSKFRDEQLKMSHFLLFNKLIQNPWMSYPIFQELYKWQIKDFQNLHICQCVILQDYKQNGLTFDQTEFIQHIVHYHSRKNLELSSHIVDLQQTKVIRNSKNNITIKIFIDSNRFLLMKKQKQQKLRQKLFNSKCFIKADMLALNPYYTRSEIFAPIIKCKQLKIIYKCNQCKTFFKCYQQMKQHIVASHRGVSPLIAQKEMTFDQNDKKVYQEWIESVSTYIKNIKQPQIIKCGCSLHTYFTIGSYQNHMRIAHTNKIPMFSSHILNKRKQWITNPDFSQNKIIQQLEINNFYFCGHCSNILFQIKSEYIMHILRFHTCFHPKNSHYIMELNDSELFLKIQGQKQKQIEKIQSNQVNFRQICFNSKDQIKNLQTSKAPKVLKTLQNKNSKEFQNMEIQHALFQSKQVYQIYLGEDFNQFQEQHEIKFDDKMRKNTIHLSLHKKPKYSHLSLQNKPKYQSFSCGQESDDQFLSTNRKEPLSYPENQQQSRKQTKKPLNNKRVNLSLTQFPRYLRTNEVEQKNQNQSVNKNNDNNNLKTTKRNISTQKI